MPKTVRNIGELALIASIAKGIKTDTSVIKGIGDDAAVIKFTREKYLLFKTDVVVEGVHFTRKMSATLIGRKALARAVSDIAAMAGRPTYALVTLGIPPQISLAFVEQLYAGMQSVARKFQINIVGGETSKSDKIFISIALLGEVKKSQLVLRSAAEKGDVILVTGALGASFKTNKHLTFLPRVEAAQFLAGRYTPHAMIDISDGLVLDLSRILNASRVGAFLYEEFIPLHKQASLRSALYEGEDYELLFTMPGKKAARLLTDLKRHKKDFSVTCIGEIVDKKNGMVLVDRKFHLHRLRPKGYTHF